jgi:hypothetical protein
MLFRAKVVDQRTLAHNQESIKLDPWEEDIGRRNDVLPGTGPLQVGIWIGRRWPTFAFNDASLVEVGMDGEFTLYRRAIDQERYARWEQGDRFQVDSYT